MNIEHLIISGGGPSFFQVLGNIQILEQQSIIIPSKIKSIYASSSGSIVALLFIIYQSMGFTWDEINIYMTQRPWEIVFPIKIDGILSAYSQKGIFGIEQVKEVFRSFFDAKNISLDITLKELYETISPIELHFTSFELNYFLLEDISYLTHPNLSLFQAILMTCAIPIIFTPVIIEDKCYMDGGIVMNYPLKLFMDNNSNGKDNSNKKVDINTILGFKNKYNKEERLGKKAFITEESTLFDLMIGFCFRVINQLEDKTEINIPYEIENETDFLNIDFIKNSLSSKNTRIELIEKGKQTALSTSFT